MTCSEVELRGVISRGGGGGLSAAATWDVAAGQWGSCWDGTGSSRLTDGRVSFLLRRAVSRRAAAGVLVETASMSRARAATRTSAGTKLSRRTPDGGQRAAALRCGRRCGQVEDVWAAVCAVWSGALTRVNRAESTSLRSPLVVPGRLACRRSSAYTVGDTRTTGDSGRVGSILRVSLGVSTLSRPGRPPGTAVTRSAAGEAAGVARRPPAPGVAQRSPGLPRGRSHQQRPA